MKEFLLTNNTGSRRRGSPAACCRSPVRHRAAETALGAAAEREARDAAEARVLRSELRASDAALLRAESATVTTRHAPTRTEVLSANVMLASSVTVKLVLVDCSVRLVFQFGYSLSCLLILTLFPIIRIFHLFHLWLCGNEQRPRYRQLWNLKFLEYQI